MSVYIGRAAPDGRDRGYARAGRAAVLCSPLGTCIIKDDAPRQSHPYQFDPRSDRPGVRIAHRPGAHRTMAPGMRWRAKRRAAQERRAFHGALRRAPDRIRDRRFHAAEHLRLGGARPAQGLEDVLSPGRDRGVDGRYDSGRVDAAVVRGVAPRALPGEAQGAESPQDHSGEPGKAARVLTVQVARVRARRTPLARDHPADGALSDTFSVAQPVQTVRAMRIDAPCRYRSVALALGALTLAVIAPRWLAAQGNARPRRTTDLAPVASPETSSLA